MSYTSGRFFGYVLDSFLVIFVGGSLLILNIYAESFSGSLVGFLLNGILHISVDFAWMVICWTNTETFLCSVDRIDRIGANLDPEYVLNIFF